jgi:hypothetical protein
VRWDGQQADSVREEVNEMGSGKKTYASIRN